MTDPRRVAGEEEDSPWAVIHFLYPDNNYPGQKDNYIKTTRYTFWNFIPKTLYENFRNLTNVYFLIVTIISALPYSPVNYVFNLLPLLFVLFVQMLKSGIEDYLKLQKDRVANSKAIEIYKFGEWQTCQSKDIKTGDLVMLRGDMICPCDMLYLTSSNPNKTCNFSEINLNGESAIKTMSQHAAFKGKNIPYFFNREHFEIHVGPPSPDLYKFDCKLTNETNTWGVSIHNILLRGVSLHYADWVMGVAIRTGHDCTIMKNQRTPPAKMTSFDKSLNRMIMFIFIFKIILIIILSLCSMFFEKDEYILQPIKDNMGLSFVKALMQNFIVYSYMIPISLMVTVEIVRVFHITIVNLDELMTDDEFGTPELHNSNMIVQLANVTHVLSDKTGTLTENVMELVRFVDRSGIYMSEFYLDEINLNPSIIDQSIEFINALAICNTVVVYKNPSGILEYNAESPDEAAFVKFASQVGVTLIDRQPDLSVIERGGERSEYKIVSVIPFNSDRKRMSIVVQKGDSPELIVYCKGADSIMYPLCNEVMFEAEVNDFAVFGLRTLVFTKRVLNETESQEWLEAYHTAESAISNREEALFAIAPMIESKLDILGVSAVEDKLQADVPESIEWLRTAGVAVWVLTGDKLETAIEIGKASSVIPHGSDVLILDEDKEEQLLARIIELKENIESYIEPVLVLTAETTKIILQNKLVFMSLAVKCKSAIFSRVSPGMKAEIVAMVKACDDTITLAVGDGANDVGMIQESHIGVGIMGHEGSQAAMSADVALPRFKHLIRLLAVHGHWCFTRFNVLAMFMFYKNFVFIFVIFWLSFDTLASPSMFYNDFFVTCFNLVFTLVPPFAFGFFEQDIPQQALLRYPQLHGTLGTPMNSNDLAYYIGIAIYQACVIYFGVRLTMPEEAFYVNGTISYFTVVIGVTVQLFFWTKNWNGFIFGSLVFTFVIIYGISFFYAYVIDNSLISITISALIRPRAIVTIVLCLMFGFFPTFVIEYIKDMQKPSLVRLLREREELDKDDPLDFTQSMHLPMN